MRTSKTFLVPLFLVTVLIFSNSCKFNNEENSNNTPVIEEPTITIPTTPVRIYVKERTKENPDVEYSYEIFYDKNKCTHKDFNVLIIEYKNNVISHTINTFHEKNEYTIGERGAVAFLLPPNTNLHTFNGEITVELIGNLVFYDLHDEGYRSVTISRTSYKNGGGSGSGSGSSTDFSTVKGTYKFTSSGGTEATGTLTLSNDGNWSYSGSKTEAACKSGSYTVSGSNITLNYVLKVGGSDIASSDTFTISNSGSSSTWTFNGIKSPLFGSLFGITGKTITFTKE